MQSGPTTSSNFIFFKFFCHVGVIQSPMAFGPKGVIRPPLTFIYMYSFQGYKSLLRRKKKDLIPIPKFRHIFLLFLCFWQKLEKREGKRQTHQIYVKPFNFYFILYQYYCSQLNVQIEIPIPGCDRHNGEVIPLLNSIPPMN